jgi:hypothetical protein
LNNRMFQDWIDGDTNVLYCRGGRKNLDLTVLTYTSWRWKDNSCVYSIRFNRLSVRSIAVDYVLQRFRDDPDIKIACVYFEHKQSFTAADIIRSVLKQLVQCRPLTQEIRDLYSKHLEKDTQPLAKEVTEILKGESQNLTKMFVVLDALDECLDPDTRSKILIEFQNLKPKVRIMITGRPDITNTMSLTPGYQLLEILAHNQDIENLFGAKLNRI